MDCTPSTNYCTQYTLVLSYSRKVILLFKFNDRSKLIKELIALMRDDKDVCRRQDMAAAMEDQMMQRWLPQTKDDNKNGWEWQQ
jgi:hypothetical protein